MAGHLIKIEQAENDLLAVRGVCCREPFKI